MIKKLIAENLGFIQWLFTWLILVGMIAAGYSFVPVMLDQHEAMKQLDLALRASGSTGVNGLAFTLPLAPLIFFTIFSSGLISLIWQFRFVDKEE